MTDTNPATNTAHRPAGTSHLADIAATLASIDRSLQTIAESLANPTPWNVTVH